MKRKSKRRVYITSTILLISIILLILFRASIQQTFGFNEISLQQITSRPQCGNTWCYDHVSEEYTSTSTFQLGKDSYKVQSTVENLCGTTSTGYNFYSCCESVSISRNGVVIDTLKTGYGADRVGENTATVKEYGDQAKLKVSLMTQVWKRTDGCSAISNSFYMSFAPSALDVSVSVPQTIYAVKDEIPLDILIQNNIVPTQAKLKIKYEVPTTIGLASKTDEQTVNLTLGSNTVRVNIPSDKPTDLLEVTPELEILYPTSSISGVNLAGKAVKDIPYISLGTYKANTTRIQITNGDLKPNIQPIDPPKNSSSQSNDSTDSPTESLNHTEEDTISQPQAGKNVRVISMIMAGIFVTLLIVFVTIYVRRARKRK